MRHTDFAFLSINCATGRVNRYVSTRLWGTRFRLAGAVDIQNYCPSEALPLSTIATLERFRATGDLHG